MGCWFGLVDWKVLWEDVEEYIETFGGVKGFFGVYIFYNSGFGNFGFDFTLWSAFCLGDLNGSYFLL